MIEQFIAQAVDQLGISKNDAEEGTSGLLSLLQNNTDSDQFAELLSRVGGAESLMNKFEAGNSSDSTQNLMGNLMSAAGGMLGSGSGGNIAAVAGLLSQVNLDASQLGSLASLFFDFIKGQAGESLANNLIGGFSDLLSSGKAA